MSIPKSEADSERDAEVHIDFAAVSSEREVHELFAHSLHFPDYYGYNWDAFQEVLTDLEWFPHRLILSSTEHLRTTVPRAYEMLQGIFNNCTDDYPDLAPEVIWR